MKEKFRLPDPLLNAVYTRVLAHMGSKPTEESAIATAATAYEFRLRGLPEELFTRTDLDRWAVANGYTKGTE